MIDKFNQMYTALSLKPEEQAVIAFVVGLAGAKAHKAMGSPIQILQMAQGQVEAPEYLVKAMNMVKLTSESALAPMFLKSKLDELLISKSLSPDAVDSLLIKASGIIGVTPSEDRIENLSAISQTFLENQSVFEEKVTAGTVCPRCGSMNFF